MDKQLKLEIESLIKVLDLNCSVDEFSDKIDWYCISSNQKLSMKFLAKYSDKVNWDYISMYQKLSLEFLAKYSDKVNWYCISSNQKLSESFIAKFSDKIYWYNISICQKLSESFIAKYSGKVNWDCISIYQKLSEEFIAKFSDKVNWYNISKYQKLSESFIAKYKDKLLPDVNSYQKVHHRSIEDLIIEIKAYSDKWKLKFDGKFLYAYREHDKNGCGIFNKTIVYENSKYYTDWHLDLVKSNENSFGLGIFPKGNVKVRVKVEDWGIEVNRDDGKARVMGFEIV